MKIAAFNINSLYTLSFLLCLGYSSLAQDCLEYAEIEGSECVFCVPSGWSPLSGTSPDIIPDDGTWPGGVCMVDDLSGASPGGGNMVLFVSQGNNYQEGMVTTVSGLDTNQEYGFGLYWEEVTLSGCGDYEEGELLLTLDGEEYEFSGSSDWEFIEICFEPSSSSIEIELMINSTGNFALVVDSPSCEEITPCCPLTLIVDELEYSGCPGEDIPLFANFEDEEGSVNIEWTCDPAIGENYLSATDEISPNFFFPFSEDFEGEVYKFTLTIEDDNCLKTEECIEVEVFPSVAPEFDIFICEVYDQDVFPEESLNGYFGVWDGDFDFDDNVGTIQEFTFILDPGQDNCIQSYVFEIPIEPAVEPFFDFNTTYCVLDDERYELPDESEEGIEGEWFPDQDFRPTTLGADVFTYEFVPDVEEYCSFNYIIEIEVLEPDSLEFNLPNSFCKTNEFFVLPEQSIQGIFGTWSVDSIDLSTAVTNETLLFTPEDINDCYYEFEWTYSIGDNITPTFDLPDSLCRSNEVISFNPISLEGNSGSWSPSIFSTDTIGSSIEATWTPESLDTCSQSIEVIIPIIENISLNLSIPDSICASSTFYILPIPTETTGVWNIDSINLEVASDQLVSINFIPDDPCYSEFQKDIFIQAKEDPLFTLPSNLCQSQLPLTLPLLSENNIEGLWSLATISEDTLGTVTSLFTPIDQDCNNTFSYTIEVGSQLIPEFNTLPEFLCVSGSNYTLSNISDNGIQGTWDINEFDPSFNYSNNIFISTFTPNDLTCALPLEISISILNFNNLTLISTSPSSCAAEDGRINFQPTDPNLEYSLDGINWRDLEEIDNLNGGIYNVQVRQKVLEDCIEIFNVTIDSPDGPQIINLLTSNLSNCNIADGLIECEAVGNTLEYSLDAINWQINNTFDNLNDGNYTVYVRSNGDDECITEGMTIIESPEDVNIVDIEVNNIEDCDISNGVIIINATGDNLEFSIDSGTTWTTANSFSDLSDGSYTVIVRDANATNCSDQRIVEILAPDFPMITEVNPTSVTSCINENGSIEIISSTPNIEYSIDGGNSWSANNLFESLPSGTYNISIRIINTQNCISNDVVELLAPSVPTIDNLQVIDATDCITPDASITLNSDINSAEYSIDQIDWQADNTFENLDFGDYTIYVRDSNNPDCINFQSFNIERPDCPCNDLVISADIVDVNCIDENSGAITINNISGFYTNEDFNLEWNTGSQALDISNLSQGSYSVNVSYDLNCEYQEVFEVDAFDPLSFGLQSFDQNCIELGSIEVTSLEGGSGNFQFSLDNINFQNESTFFNLSADEYAVFINDFFNCAGNDAIDVDFIDNLDLEIPDIPTITQGESVILNPLINQNTIDNFEWSPQEGILNPGELIAEVAPLESTEYTLTIYFGDCIETRTVLVNVDPRISIYIPNIINVADRDNSFYISSASDIIEIEFMNIYDRWGNLVYRKENPQINNPSDGWDGRYGDDNVIPGVYTYYIKLKETFLNEDFLAGSITVLY